MNHIIFWLLANLLLTAICADAQQQTKIPKLGWLALQPPGRIATSPSSNELFWREFNKLGYLEGKNIQFEYRSANNRSDRLTTLADELVRLKVDVLISASTSEIRAAKNATRTIPIVFMSPGDPVDAGYVASLARPGGNLTGFSNFQYLLTGKLLEILKDTVPKLSRVAMVRDPRSPAEQLRESEAAAKALGLQLYVMKVGSVDQFDNACKETIRERCAALTVGTSGFLNSNMSRTIAFAARYKLPAIYARQDFAECGGMKWYGADQSEPYKRLAVMVDKILKGSKPADIPVEQPMAFEFVINLKAAKQIDFTIPPEILARANRIIR